MEIPDHLVPLIRRLAAQEFIEKYNQAALLDRRVDGKSIEDQQRAHQFLDEARELNALVNPVSSEAQGQAA